MSIEVKPLLEGRYLPGACLPVRLTLDNRGPGDWTGSMVVDLGSATYTLSPTLSSPSRKAFYLELPKMPRTGTLEVRLGEGEVVARAQVEPLPSGSSLLVLASRPGDREPSGAGNGEPTLGESHLVVVPMSALPDRFKGYESVDAVALEAAAGADLLPLQRRALADWLRLGGRLLVLGGAMPLPEAGSAVLEHSGYGPPLLVGRGMIRVARTAESRVSADEIREALAPSRMETLQDLLRGGSTPRGWGRPRAVAFLFVATYFFAVIVLSGSLARRPRRLPGLVYRGGLAALFVLTSRGFGWLATGGGDLATARSITRVFAGEDEAFVATAADVVAATGGTLRLSSLLRSAYVEAEGPGVSYGIDPAERASVSLEAHPWRRRLVYTEGLAGVGVSVRVRGDREVEIRNDSQADLESCVLLTPRGMSSLPGIPAGGSLSIDEARPRQSSDPVSLVPRNQLLRRVLSAESAALAASPWLSDQIVCSNDGAELFLAGSRGLALASRSGVTVLHLGGSRL